MVKVDIELNVIQGAEDYCNPCLLVTDTIGDRCPIILPENMETEYAKELANKLKKDIEGKYETAEEVREAIYGQLRGMV
ncbi:hypothetical protein [Bacillus mojavensis]